MAEPTGAVALEDPATLAGVAILRRRSRRPVVRTFLALVAASVGVALAAELGQDGAAAFFGTVAFLAGLVLVATLLTHPIRSRAARRARRVLGRSTWRVVEVVRVPGKGPAGPMVVVLHPRTGQPAGTWILEDSWHDGWPVADVRTWALLAMDAQGRRAILASVDRTTLASLLSTTPIGTDGDPHEWAWGQAATRWDLGPPSSGIATWAEPPFDDLGPSPSTAEPESLNLTVRQWAAAAMVAGVLAVVATGFGVSGRQAHDREDRAVRRDGVRASGLVQGVENPRGGRRGPTMVHVQLETGDYAGNVARVETPAYPHLQRGDPVTVAYRQDQPEDLVVLGVSDPSRGSFYVVLAWVAAVGLTCRATRDRRNAGVAPPPIDVSSSRFGFLASPLGLTRLRLRGDRAVARGLARSTTARRRLYGWRRIPSAALVAGMVAIGMTGGVSWFCVAVIAAAVAAAVADAYWVPRQVQELAGGPRPDGGEGGRPRSGHR